MLLPTAGGPESAGRGRGSTDGRAIVSSGGRPGRRPCSARPPGGRSRRCIPGVAGRAGIAEDVVGDPVHVVGVTLDDLRLLVVLGGSLAQAVLRVRVLFDV